MNPIVGQFLERMKSSPVATLAAVSQLPDDEQFELLDHLSEMRREKARTSLVEYAKQIEVPGAPIPESEGFYPLKLKLALHHELILSAIEAVVKEDSEAQGLMLFFPPGSAKSTMASTIATSWLLGRYPGINLMGLSYGQDLANRFARRTRAICQSNEFREIFGTTVSDGNAAVDSWSLGNGSDYRAAGLGSAITGMRARVAIIDDPVKDRESADSDVQMQKLWDGYLDNVSTRLLPRVGRVVLIMTRWSGNDLAGRLLGENYKGQSGLWKCTDGRTFLVLRVPMEADSDDDPLQREKSELLWPDWFSQQEVDRLKTQPRLFSALYQQTPSSAEGSIIRRADWKPWGRLIQNDRGEWVNTKPPPECSYLILSYDWRI
jgi:hypothetical protein